MIFRRIWKPQVRTRVSFIGATATLASGSGVGQALVIVTSPLLTRLYEPADFGVLAVYSAIIAFLILLASLRYELAILLPRSDRVAGAILVLCSVVLGGFTGAVVLGVWGVGWVAPQWVDGLLLGEYLWLLPLAALCGGAYKVASFWALRKQGFRRVALTRLAQDGTMVGVQIGAGLFSMGGLGLVLGHLLGVTVAAGALMRTVAGEVRRAVKGLGAKQVIVMARRYRRFPMFMAWGDFANAAGKQLPVLFFASLFGPATAGLYLLANRVANAPVALVSDAVNKVFLSLGAAARHQGRLPSLAFGVLRLLLKVSILPFMLVGIVAADLFGWVFGTAWKEAGHYLQLLIPHMVAVFVFVPILGLFTLLERQRFAMVFQFTLVTTSAATLATGWWLGDVRLAVLLYSLGTATVYAGFGLWILNAAGVYFGRGLAVIGSELALAGMLSVGVLGLRQALGLEEVTVLDGRLMAFLSLIGLLLVWAFWRSRTAWSRLRCARHAAGAMAP